MQTRNKVFIVGVILLTMVVLAYTGIKPITAKAATSGSILMNYDFDGGDDPDCAGLLGNGGCVKWGDGHDRDAHNLGSAQFQFCLDKAAKFASGLSDISGLTVSYAEVAKQPAKCLDLINGDNDGSHRTYLVSFVQKCTQNATKQCVGNSVYNFDSCGAQGSVFQACSSNQVCQNAQCVNIACTTNSQCGNNGSVGSPFCQGNNIYQNYKTYTCNSPGQITSSCTNFTTARLQNACYGNQTCSNGRCVSVICSTNLQCGSSGPIGAAFCQGNSVYQNYKTYTCNNPGTPSSSCTNYTTARLQNACNGNQTCDDGRCINQNIACNSDFQCGANAPVGAAFCQGNNIYQNYRTYICSNPGTPSSRCTNSTAAQLQNACNYNQTCSNGGCVNQNIACNSDFQCGANAPVGAAFCQGNNIYQNYRTYTCSNPGTPSSRCSNSTAAQLQNACNYNQTCSNGSCVNQNIACNSDSQCGANASVGAAFCQGNNIYQNYRTYTCSNPGTSASRCTNSTAAQLQNTCNYNQTCSNGSCVNQNIACNSDSQCGSSGPTGAAFCQGNSVYQNYRTYTCSNPGTSASRCTNSSVAQLQDTCDDNQTCSNGSCVTHNIACNSDSQCGSSAPIGAMFCQGNSVYQNYKTYTCSNPGTSASRCTNSSAAQLQDTCDYNQRCSNGSCVSNCVSNSQKKCSGDDLYWYDSCGNKQGLAQDCPDGCSNNACIIKKVTCSNDHECGFNSLSGNPFCQGNSVYQNQITRFCNNPGTSQSFCSSTLVPQLISGCGTNRTCVNGSCTSPSIACGSDSDCGFSILTGNAFCQGNTAYKNYLTHSCNNPGTSQSFCSSSLTPQLIETCSPSQDCVNGSCSAACTSNSQQRCFNNSLYWTDSCGGQQGFIRNCPNGCSGSACL